MGEIEDFVGCKIKSEITKMALKIYQSYIITNANQGFNKYVKSFVTFNTPATPHRGIVLNQETETKIPYNLQKRYRSGVGSLLYIVKHSLPELYNAVWELSKSMEKSNMRHYKSLLHSTNYAIDAKYNCYHIKPEGNLSRPWELR